MTGLWVQFFCMKKRLGDILIIASLTLFGFIYLPFLLLFTPHDFNVNAIGNQTYIAIDRIHAYSLVIENIDPWKESEYKPALEKGVALAKGFAPIGASGTVYLFAHSSLPPWEMTRLNTAFLRLRELKLGDSIKLFKNGKEYDYKVVDKKEVNPNETRFLYNQDGKDQLILQTCTPLGTDWRRLLIFARPT